MWRVGPSHPLPLSPPFISAPLWFVVVVVHPPHTHTNSALQSAPLLWGCISCCWWVTNIYDAWWNLNLRVLTKYFEMIMVAKHYEYFTSDKTLQPLLTYLNSINVICLSEMFPVEAQEEFKVNYRFLSSDEWCVHMPNHSTRNYEDLTFSLHSAPLESLFWLPSDCFPRSVHLTAYIQVVKGWGEGGKQFRLKVNSYQLSVAL